MSNYDRDAEAESMNPAPVKQVTSFETFQQMDIRLGTISCVEDVEESGKLVKLVVDFGDHSRSIDPLRSFTICTE
jgi:tRNA-binding EMAP/Myf-like protein